MRSAWALVAVLLGGCLQPAPPPDFTLPGGSSGGDAGPGWPGGPSSGPGPSGPPATNACPDVQDQGQALPFDRSFDFAGGETQQLKWHALHSGRYTIAATAGATLVVHLGDCAGIAVTATSLALFSGQAVTLDVTGSGTVEVTIDKLPDACGDDVCEESEVCDACDADCGACPPADTCGDGFCGISETEGSCSIDCSYQDPGSGDSGGGTDDGGTSSDDGGSDDGGWGDDGGGDDGGGWGDDGGDDGDDGGWGDDGGDDGDDGGWGDDGDDGDDWFYKNPAKPDTRLSKHPAKLSK